MDFKVDARPVKEGKDPLTEGNSLSNPSNTEDHNSYELLESSEELVKSERAGLRKRQEYHVQPQVTAPRVRKIPNKSETDLAAAVKSSKRQGR